MRRRRPDRRVPALDEAVLLEAAAGSLRLSLSRRDLLKLAGAAGALGAAGAACASSPLRAGDGGDADVARRTWQHEADVVVVGTGAAGLVAALAASEHGAKVVVLEKALLVGGTTAKSGGVYWVPNNRFREGKGDEPREATLRAMARASYPQLFDEDAERFGLPAREWSVLEALYDTGPAAVDALAKMGALDSQPAENPFGPMPDYFDTTTADGTPRDRRLWPRKPDGSFGLGDEMIRQLRVAAEGRGIPILKGHRVSKLLANARREVVGVEATPAKGGATVSVRARRGVVFASGGFTHNDELMRAFQPGPVFGGCAVPTNTGDFVALAQGLGAKLGHMGGAWRAQVVLEQALQFSSTPDDVFMPPGDSMVVVDKKGRRVVNETSNYNERTRVHFAWDPSAHEWTNLVLFMVYDQRTADLFGGRFPLPAAGATAPYVLTGDTLPALAGAIDARLAKLASRVQDLRLHPDFASELGRTIARFNDHARRGVDPDFQRGAHLYDRMWHSRIWSFPNPGTKWAFNTGPNPTMHPFTKKGPYHAILLAGGTLDTNGGPVIDARAQVLDAADRPIAGLYGAGNCVASPTGSAYYAGGGTLGPALAFGWIAGREAAGAPPRDLA